MLHFDVKVVQTDRQTDGRTKVKQYDPDLSMRGHKKKPNEGKGEIEHLTPFSISFQLSPGGQCI